MTDYDSYPTISTVPNTDDLREKIAELQIERNKAQDEVEALRSLYRRLISSMQQDLEGFAADNLSPGDDDYRELSELMVSNGLDGLKRTFTVTVKVHYEFEVEVEATDEDSARDEVDNELDTHLSNGVELSSYYDYDIEADEA